jgi:prepilin-type N-terminal cleavage/methylation domain-containing protein
MKKAFTMIELIFVIVILGILAAVALPKFLGVANQAHQSNLKSFVGTLNRTVGPTLWSKSIASGKNGDISDLNTTEGEAFLKTYVDIPKEINASSINLRDCNSTSTANVVMTIDKNVAGFEGNITCIDGNANQSPKFNLNIAE